MPSGLAGSGPGGSVAGCVPGRRVTRHWNQAAVRRVGRQRWGGAPSLGPRGLVPLALSTVWRGCLGDVLRSDFTGPCLRCPRGGQASCALALDPAGRGRACQSASPPAVIPAAQEAGVRGVRTRRCLGVWSGASSCRRSRRGGGLGRREVSPKQQQACSLPRKGPGSWIAALWWPSVTLPRTTCPSSRAPRGLRTRGLSRVGWRVREGLPF